MAKNDGKNVYCNFCGKSQNEVSRLIGGHNAYICNECIEKCLSIISDDYLLKDDNRYAGSSDISNMALPKPAEIKAFMDDYIMEMSIR